MEGGGDLSLDSARSDQMDEQMPQQHSRMQTPHTETQK